MNKRIILRNAFTLMEVMFVIGVIAFFAATIATPSFLRARKRSQAARIIEELRIVDSAIDLYAIENHKASGDGVAWADIQNYLKAGSVLYNSGGSDVFGALYVGFSVDSYPKLRLTTYQKLSDVVPLNFWSPYYP